MTDATAPVQVSKDSRIGIITLTAPQRRNALTVESVHRLHDGFASLDRDREVRAIVLRAEGPVFCAGGDITVFDRDMAGGRDYLYDVIGLFRLIEGLRTPVICAVSGAALGGGFELALACDVLVASRDATFGLPELSVGAVPAFALQRLAEIAGRAWTKRLAWTQERVTAGDAYSHGAVTIVVDSGEADLKALEWARQISGLPRVAVETVKASVNRAVADGALNDSVSSGALMWGTKGITEGRQAFLDKRPPVFPDE